MYNTIKHISSNICHVLSSSYSPLLYIVMQPYIYIYIYTRQTWPCYARPNMLDFVTSFYLLQVFTQYFFFFTNKKPSSQFKIKISSFRQIDFILYLNTLNRHSNHVHQLSTSDCLFYRPYTTTNYPYKGRGGMMYYNLCKHGFSSALWTIEQHAIGRIYSNLLVQLMMTQR